MFRKTVPGDWSGNAETSFAVFSCSPRHGQISVFCRTETSSAREIHREYADVLEICRTSTSDAGKCEKCKFKLYSVSYRQPV